MAQVDVKCPFCERINAVKKHGLGNTGHQRYRCQLCCRIFQLQLICDVDEMWSFVGNKKQLRWLWYAWDPRLKRVIAHAFGRRNKKDSA